MYRERVGIQYGKPRFCPFSFVNSYHYIRKNEKRNDMLIQTTFEWYKTSDSCDKRTEEFVVQEGKPNLTAAIDASEIQE